MAEIFKFPGRKTEGSQDKVAEWVTFTNKLVKMKSLLSEKRPDGALPGSDEKDIRIAQIRNLDREGLQAILMRSSQIDWEQSPDYYSVILTAWERKQKGREQE